MKHVPNFFTL